MRESETRQESLTKEIEREWRERELNYYNFNNGSINNQQSTNNTPRYAVIVARPSMNNSRNATTIDVVTARQSALMLMLPRPCCCIELASSPMLDADTLA